MTQEAWNAYPARVDGEPASILVAMHYEAGTRPAGAESLFVVGLPMGDPGEHGMGTAAEAQAMAPLEDALQGSLESRGFVFVGRLRSQGTWQLSFYGPREGSDAFEQVLREQPAMPAQGAWTHSEHDPEWGYFTSFLLPDEERRRWLRNAAVVEQLRAHGDRLAQPRRVDHWLAFRSLDGLRQFRELAHQNSFQSPAEEPEPQADGTLPLRLSREDPVELDAIHTVVMALLLLAEPLGGTYGGWETQVVRAEP